MLEPIHYYGYYHVIQKVQFRFQIMAFLTNSLLLYLTFIYMVSNIESKSSMFKTLIFGSRVTQEKRDNAIH